MPYVYLFDAEKKKWLNFREPTEIISTEKLEEVLPCLKSVETRTAAGFHAAGFICYEAAPAFDKAMTVREKSPCLPLLWFGIYRDFEEVDKLPLPDSGNEYSLSWKPSITRDDYDRAIAAVRNYIRLGHTYQVNYTFRQTAGFAHSPWDYFRKITSAQNALYSLFIETDDFAICSASPELFFTCNKGVLSSKPMKGTAARGLTAEQDMAQADFLYHSKKNRAENLMIVDMIRNDLGRVSETGSVVVDKLFEVEKYPTLWQMTSTVRSRSGKGLADILCALFPCASITGAPKIRTMEIIAELENTPRGIYTGAAGFVLSDRRVQFNVAIRTVTIDKKNKTAEYGVGGGIVWDSTAEDEYEECLTKTKFLTQKYPEFSILESLLWTKSEGFFLLEYHLDRLKASAGYFDYPFNRVSVETELEKVTRGLTLPKYKIRILLKRDGTMTSEAQELTEERINKTLNVVVAKEPVRTDSPFLYHKTTNRQAYNLIKDKYPGYDDVIFMNEKGELTESTVTNIAVKINGVFYTPPVACGLLGGTFRRHLVDTGEISERILYIGDLKTAEEVRLMNSVRKWIKIKQLTVDS